MIPGSPDLRSVIERVLGAFERRDGATLRAMIDRSAHTLLIGSDAREWHYGETAVDLIGTQVEGMPTYRSEIHRIDASESDGFGWASCASTAVFDSGATVEIVFGLPAASDAFYFGEPLTAELKGIEGTRMLYPVESRNS